MKQQIERKFETKSSDVTIKATVTYDESFTQAGIEVVKNVLHMMRFLEAPNQTSMDLDTGIVVELNSKQRGVFLETKKPEAGKVWGCKIEVDKKTPVELTSLIHAIATSGDPFTITFRQDAPPVTKTKTKKSGRTVVMTATDQGKPKSDKPVVGQDVDGFGKPLKPPE